MPPSEATSEHERKIMTAKPKCYETMFPDLSKVLFNTPVLVKHSVDVDFQ